MAASEFDTVLVLDFGAQYAQLIARRVRECRVHSEIVPAAITPAEVRRRAPKGLILSGGPKSVNQPGAYRCDPGLFALGIPVLGICYGHQLMADTLGGSVAGGGTGGEFGRTSVTLDGGLLFEGLAAEQTAWMSHNDAVVAVPDGFRATAASPGAPVAAMEHADAGLFGVQFHPEVAHTPSGTAVLKNFLLRACDCLPTWTAGNVIAAAVDKIRAQVGDHPVVCGLSGGVDSAVAAALVHRAVGDRLSCIFVDHGLLRAGEAEQVVDTFGGHFKMDLHHVKAADRFLERLAGVTDPEEKRKIIGTEFIRVFEEAAREIAGAAAAAPFLVQGTLYPDVIESGAGGVAARIKTHHNVGGLPDDMAFDLVEPLRDLFKDEVRRVGEELGLPEEIVWRQPFPGPGLAVRVLGDLTPERLATVRAADAIVLAELHRAGLSRQIWQSFAVLLPVRTVGVMGDERTYGNVVAVRAVESEDAMTADWARVPYEVLDTIAGRIVAEVPGVSRVVYDISSKPPATIEWE